MPHNLYLHSGALESRRAPNVEKYKRQAVWLGLWDPFIPILSTTVVNWAIAALAAIFVYGNTNVPDNLGIASFPKYLQVKGGTIMWGIALIAAAQSSCITTTYSGQFVMDGFLKINFYTLVAPNGAYFGQYTSMATVVGVQMNIIQDLVCAFYIVCCVYMAFAPVKGSPLPIRQEMGDPQIDTELAQSIEKKSTSVEMGSVTNPPQ